jgi:hypothetical protein
MMRQAALVATIVVVGCAGSTPRGHSAAADLEPQFESTGQILYAGPLRRTMTYFDDNRVIGPGVQMSRNPDGTWSGWLQGRAIKVEVDAREKSIDGAAISIKVDELSGSGLEIRGHWSVGRRAEQLYVRVTPKDLFARGPTGSPSLLLNASGVGNYKDETGGEFAVQLMGDAALPHPPQPQFTFAILGALSG